MKFRLIPLAAVIASTFAMSAQAEGPIDGKVYGKLRVAVDYKKEEKSSSTVNSSLLRSSASRLGFKGKTALSDYNDLNVIYQAEYGIDGQINNGDNFSARNTFVGLQGGFGTLLAGRHDTPMKGSQGKADQFNDLDGDMGNIFNGENRLNQVVMYSTPSFSGLSGSVAYVLSKNNMDNSNNSKSYSKNGVSAALMFDQGMFYGALAYDNNVKNADSIRVTAVVNPIDALTLGAVWHQTKYNDQTQASGLVGNTQAGDSKSGYLVSAAYKLGKATVKAEYGDSDVYKLGLAKFGKDASIGADYKLAKNTKVEGWVTQLKNSDADKKDTYVALGMEHKF